MDEIREILDREARRVAPRPGAFDRLVRLRRRRQRNRRIASAALALMIMAAGLWAAAELVGGVGPRPRPSSRLIMPSNVSRLRVLWTGSHNGNAPAMTVGGNEVYVAASPKVLAFPLSCGRPTCTPLWFATIVRFPPSPVPPTLSPPAVVGGLVYVTGSRLYAFPAHCGTGNIECVPVWQSPPSPSGTYGGPAVADGVVYVTSDRALYAFSLSCGTGGATCRPLWQAPVGSGSQAPAVSQGMVYVTSDRLYAFPGHCPSKGACRPVWTANVQSDVPPTVSGGTVYVSSENVYAFPAKCDAPCQPLWVGPIGRSFPPTRPVVGDGRVFVGADRLYAFPATCRTDGMECRPAWTGPAQASLTPQQWSTPAVVNGVVFSTTDGPYAFRTLCRNDGGLCHPLWRGRVPGGESERYFAPAASARMLYVGHSDGGLYAFGLPSP